MLVEGGRKRNNQAPLPIFLSSDEDSDFKETRELLMLRQNKIMLDLKQDVHGYSDDQEDFNPKDLYEYSFDEDIMSENSDEKHIPLPYIPIDS